MARKKTKKYKKKTTKQPLPPKEKKKVQVVEPDAYPAFGKKQWLTSLIFIALAFILYAVSMNYGYVLDDTIVITDNQYTQKGFGGIWEIFSTESFAGYFGGQMDLVQGARYRPLSIATFAIEQGLFGSNPGISHGINIFLYGLTGIALYYLLHLLYNKKESHLFWNIAFVASLIYMAHPIHTEAVANIKGRDEIMTFIFALLSMIGILKWDQRKKLIYGIISGFLFLLALFAKENAITFLAIVPAGLYIFRKKSIADSLKMTIPLIMASIIYLIIRYTVIGYLLNSATEITDLMNNPFVDMNMGEKLATIFFTLWKYIQLSIFPHPLAHDYYPYAIPKLHWGDYRAFLPFIFYLGLGVISVWALIKRKTSWYGVIFFLAALSIVSNIVVVVGTFMNERFIYMASAGICMLMGVFFVRYLSQLKFRYCNYLSIGLVGLIVLGYSWKTWDRVPDWKDALTLNYSAVKVNPGSARANSFMATAIYNEVKDLPSSPEKMKDLETALAYADKAISIYPRYKNPYLMKAGIAAEMYKYDNNLDALFQRFKEVMAVRPDISYLQEYLRYLHSRAPREKLVNFYYDAAYNMLFTQMRNGRFSLQFMKMAEEVAPDDRRVIQALAEIHQAMGNQAAADQYFNRLQ